MSLNFKFVLLLVILSHFSETFGHRTPAYSHDGHSSLDNSRWMANINNSTILLDISIPGTHDTMSLGYGGDIAQCQSLPLSVQLKAGIRVLDIRCRHINNKFAIHHGVEFQHVWFGTVLKIVTDFLEENPSEAILMRVKEEWHPQNNNRTFEETFEFYANEEANGHIWIPNKNTSQVPNLGDVRGKIVILDDFSSFAAKYGLNYQDDSVFGIQDDFKFHDNWSLYDKWIDVKEQVYIASSSKSPKLIYINYLSGAGGSFPYFVASGHSSHGTGAHRLATGFTTPGWKHKYPEFPRVNCAIGICTIAFEGTNVMLYNYLNKGSFRHVGIIMSDFPGDGLIQEIINLNFNYSEQFANKMCIGTILIISISILSVAILIIRRLRFRRKLVSNYYTEVYRETTLDEKSVSVSHTFVTFSEKWKL